MEAAAASKVSPYHLASRVKQEVVISSTMMSSSVSGNVAGYKGIYNFYNIGANSGANAVKNGLKWASTGTDYSRPWNNRYRSIYGGACYIGKQYINVGQNTLYLQKFNVTATKRYDHQYMANIEAPNNEATKTANAYGGDKDNTPIVFSIPVYNNMPVSACDIPSGGKNPNNYLKNLYVQGHAFSAPFALGDTGSKTYKTTVANKVKSVKVVASAVSTAATVTGTAFALNFGVPFYSLLNDKSSSDDRMGNLLRLCGMEDRGIIINTRKVRVSTSFDINGCETRLRQKREESIAYLQRSLM